MRANLCVRLFRTLLALTAILPGLVVGVVVLATTWNRRRAVNSAMAVWGWLGPRAAGIDLNVEGAQWLTAARPCVFLINHQSGVDPIILAAILQRDFVGVAKAEIRRNPLLGPAFALAGAIFIDRFDTTRALEALRPAVDTLRRGVSIAIAPEGTRRLGGERVGPFKKGGFHIAMAARVPIVPIVICNSRDVLPHDGWLMCPARVRVVVHPPVPTTAWSTETLEAEIAALHRLYEETLDQFWSARG